MRLTPLICTQCGGQIDRVTMTCQSCQTQFELSGEQTLVIREHLPNEYTIGASLSIDPRNLYFGQMDYLNFAVEELSHKLAEGLAPFMEVEQLSDLSDNSIMLNARLRLLKPSEPTAERYTSKSILFPKQRS